MSIYYELRGGMNITNSNPQWISIAPDSHTNQKVII